MIKITYKGSTYWYCAWSRDGKSLTYYDKEPYVFTSPDAVLKHALEKGSNKFGASGLIFVHESWAGNCYTRHHFHTLAAANRFHKAQATAKASDLTKSQLIRKELNKQPA